MTTTAYLGLGANLGDAPSTVKQAIACLTEHPDIHNLRAASLYQSHPVDAPGDNYCNTAVALTTQLPARALLALCQHLESQFHRTRTYRNAPRTLDIDILLYGTQCIEQEGLVIPHPRLVHRAFTLVPLIELDAHMEIPQAGPALAFLKKLYFSAQEAGLPPSYSSALPSETRHCLFQYIEKIQPL